VKFVVENCWSSEINEIESRLFTIEQVLTDHILLTAKGRDQSALWSKANPLITIVTKQLRKAYRLQINLFGDTCEMQPYRTTDLTHLQMIQTIQGISELPVEFYTKINYNSDQTLYNSL
jgi:hypothetical protein